MGDFADNVAKICIQKYNALKKTGKPRIYEWTVLSGIVLKDAKGVLSVVALATGTKCLGDSTLAKSISEETGSRIGDSHAEVLARRALIRYLYDQIDLILSGFKSQVFSLTNENKIQLNNRISFHFFSSQTPCGDCSILPKEEVYDNEMPPSKIRLIDDSNGHVIAEPHYKDIHRTGAKCVQKEEKQDPRLPGINYHIMGPLRTKPGRGDPTSSLSCSDKIAKWLILGLQGSLLSLLIPPIMLESITIGGDCAFSLEAMERGLYKRFNSEIDKFQIFQAKISFTDKKGQERQYSCPTSIIWCAVIDNAFEVAVDGKRQGATKKQKRNSLSVSRRMLLRCFLRICDKYQKYSKDIKHPKKITYYDWKQWSTIYQSKWNQLKLESFRNWTSKPVYLQKFIL